MKTNQVWRVPTVRELLDMNGVAKDMPRDQEFMSSSPKKFGFFTVEFKEDREIVRLRSVFFQCRTMALNEENNSAYIQKCRNISETTEFLKSAELEEHVVWRLPCVKELLDSSQKIAPNDYWASTGQMVRIRDHGRKIIPVTKKRKTAKVTMIRIRGLRKFTGSGPRTAQSFSEAASRIIGKNKHEHWYWDDMLELLRENQRKFCKTYRPEYQHRD